MTAIMPADGLHRLGIVVKDYKSSIEEFSRFFGIRQWEIRRLDERRLSNTSLRDAESKYSYISAIGNEKGIALELVQPVSGRSVFSEFLERRGEGMHHLHTNVFSTSNFGKTRQALESHGIHILQSSTIDKAVEHHFLDTRELLAGPLIQVSCSSAGTVDPVLKPDEIVRFDEHVTNWNRLPVDRIYHACIVTKGRRDQVRDSVKQLLGVEKWFSVANESEVSTADSTLYGKPCKIAFNLSLGRRNSLGLEVVEEVYGRSIYTEFLESTGEGLQHIMTTLCSEQEFLDLQSWLKSKDMPMIMDGRAATRDFCYYAYIDTRSKLAGIAVEVLCPAGRDWLEGRQEAGEIMVGT